MFDECFSVFSVLLETSLPSPYLLQSVAFTASLSSDDRAVSHRSTSLRYYGSGCFLRLFAYSHILYTWPLLPHTHTHTRLIPADVAMEMWLALESNARTHTHTHGIFTEGRLSFSFPSVIKCVSVFFFFFLWER